jgi:hypothetical protein
MRTNANRENGFFDGSLLTNENGETNSDVLRLKQMGLKQMGHSKIHDYLKG